MTAGGARPDLRTAVTAVVEQFREGDPLEMVGSAASIAARAVRSVERILGVVREAVQCGRVRWFSPDVHPGGPRRGPHRDQVLILNAGEVSSGWRPRVISPAYVVLLLVTSVTVQNRRALVTVVQHTEGEVNGVVIWSDSTGEQFADPKHVRWAETGLMTAPHHGSRDPGHDVIWTAHQSEDHCVVLLSNNSHATRQRYRDLCGRHACTHCPTTPRATRPARDAVARWCRSCSGWRLAVL